jgi:hypothetical protein
MQTRDKGSCKSYPTWRVSDDADAQAAILHFRYEAACTARRVKVYAGYREGLCGLFSYSRLIESVNRTLPQKNMRLKQGLCRGTSLGPMGPRSAFHDRPVKPADCYQCDRPKHRRQCQKRPARLRRTMMTGLLPAGGCTVRVNIISINADAAATAMGTYPGPKRWRQSNPVNDVRTWPPMMFRGCENGLEGKPNSSTQVAPNEPRIQGSEVSCANSPTKANPTNAPTPASKMLRA